MYTTCLDHLLSCSYRLLRSCDKLQQQQSSTQTHTGALMHSGDKPLCPDPVTFSTGSSRVQGFKLLEPLCGQHSYVPSTTGAWGIPIADSQSLGWCGDDSVSAFLPITACTSMCVLALSFSEPGYQIHAGLVSVGICASGCASSLFRLSLCALDSHCLRPQL